MCHSRTALLLEVPLTLYHAVVWALGGSAASQRLVIHLLGQGNLSCQNANLRSLISAVVLSYAAAVLSCGSCRCTQDRRRSWILGLC